MIEIAIGSKNKAKINAVETIVSSDSFQLSSFNTPSHVSKQPYSDEETRLGAINRAKGCFEHGTFDFAIGLEGGVIESEFGMFLCNWGALVTNDERLFVASGAKIILPERVAAKVQSGTELGEVMDEFIGAHDIRSKEGAIGIFTNGYVSRSEMFAHVVKLLVGQYEYTKKLS